MSASAPVISVGGTTVGTAVAVAGFARAADALGFAAASVAFAMVSPVGRMSSRGVPVVRLA